MSVIQELFTQKLSPKKFEQLILAPRIKNIFLDGKVEQDYLCHGSPGLGKSSLAKVLMNQVGYDHLFINASDERSVDVIREKITNFCSTLSLSTILDDDGNKVRAKKIVVLDEIDGAGDQFFKALRGTMDKFANVRFIATCNFINKIPDPVKSRFQVINFDFLDRDEEFYIREQYLLRIENILKKLGIKYTHEAVLELVTRNFPDLRSIINKIQDYKKRGLTELTTEDVKKANWTFEDVWKLLVDPNSKPKDNYQFIVGNYNNLVDDVLAGMGNEFITWLEENQSSKLNKIPEIIITVADYQSKRAMVIDPVVSLLACFYQVNMILKS